MAEAEDVITDAARFAFERVQRIRERRRGQQEAPGLAMKAVAARLDLMVSAAFGRSYRLHAAPAPLPRTMLERLFRRGQAPASTLALPATDGQGIWLPPRLLLEPDAAYDCYRALAMLQALRASRGAQDHAGGSGLAPVLFHICEAWASDALLRQLFPGLRPALATLRADALAARPDAGRMSGSVAWVEAAVQRALAGTPPLDGLAPDATAYSCAALRRCAEDAAARLAAPAGAALYKDLWLGDFKPADAAANTLPGPHHAASDHERRPRSARLLRRPQARPATEGEDDSASPGPFILQTAQPQEKAEDPFGLQRPADQDAATAAEEFGDALSELPSARLVATPGTPAEVLLSDEPLQGTRSRQDATQAERAGLRCHYPEWDYRRQQYAPRGSSVLVTQAPAGDPALVTGIMRKHALLLEAVRRGFQLLRARRSRYRHQLDGDEVDIDAWVDAACARAAGVEPDGRVFETQRMERRDLAVLVLVDVSGSTDGWITDQRRVIDVEREALLLVGQALDALGEPFSVQAFSGEGREGVVVREMKSFAEPYNAAVALRLAGIEPENYTRTGSAIRHASACLAALPARHRLLLLLTDGKPNDVDLYEGQYGVMDMRQAILEAQQLGISPFCLTIDRQGADYLGAIFGKKQFAILPRTELLASTLLSWLRHLVA
ncbi:VWA domain-containing protein [Massilia sp. SR12]